MAVSYLFDTVYSPKNVGTGAKHRLVIGTTDAISGVATQLELLDPGINLQWQGDAERFNKAVMGSTLSFTAYVNDNQLTKWENLLNQDEGKCFCLFFDSDAADAKPYWYGTLLIESTSIEVACERRKIDVVFTDGLAMLRGVPWAKANGDLYTGRRTLSFFMNEIVSKLGGFAGYKDYMNNEINQAVIPKFREIGFPWPSVENHDDDTFYDWHEADGVLEHCAVESRTFHKPKKNVDRLRELAARPEYFNTGDVLEDICKAFGATACMFEGRVNLVCRQEVAFMKGAGVYGVKYDKNTSNPFNDVVSSDTTGLFGTEGTNFDDHYVIRAGATKGKSLPFSQAILIHEDGGSDNLVQEGFFDPRGSSETGGRPNIFSDSLGPLLSNTGYRSDIKYVFENVDIGLPIPTPAADPNTGLIIDQPHLSFPKDPSTYMGFPSQEATDLEVSSGQQIRLTFGGNVRFRDVSLTSQFISAAVNQPLGRTVFGSHMVVRVRLQFTTTGDVGYRASRTVQTHVLSDGSSDGITIDFTEFNSTTDRNFFRKLYNNFAWIAEGSAGYDDAFYEILVPHGDTNNTGEGYGATVHPLTVQYAGQTPYAPIGTKIQGEDNGTGVILDKDTSSDHMYHYFREDIQLELPFGANNTTLSFEKCYFEQGVSLFEPEFGPNPNTTAQNDGSPDFEGTTPLWRSANADGTGGSKKYNSGSHWMSLPEHIHFVGARVAIGDGSESADITTKMTGGDGYEIFAMGSSRIGSRTTFLNQHASGTVFAPMKESSAENDFSIVSSVKVFKENIKWKGHAHGETNASPNTFVDSLHSYVVDTHLKLLGKSADIYTFSAMPRPGSNPDVVKSPFAVFKTDQLETNTTLFLMPLNLNWASNQGFSGTFLQVGKTRDLSTIQEIDDPVRRGGPSQDGGGGGGIVGMTGVIERINTTRTSLNTTNVAVAVNTAKVGITTAQANAITANTAKVGFPGFGTGSGTALEGNTQTIGDISSLASPLRAAGNGTVVDAIKEHPNELTFVVDSTITNQTGSKKFTVQDFFTAIVTSGLEDLDSGGFVDIADYVGTTSGVVGDFNDDGFVGSADLIQFLTLYGTAGSAFADASVQILSNNNPATFNTTAAQTLKWNASAIPSASVIPAGVSINILDFTDQIEFVTGANPMFPITAWTNKRVVISQAGTSSQNLVFGGANTTFPDTQFHVGVEIKGFDANNNVVVNDVPFLGTIGPLPNLQGGLSINFSSLDGSSRIVTSTDLSDETIVKIQVSLFAEPVDSTDTEFTFNLTNVKISLESVT